jgi:pimeloyl-ACP methyl ester carboxylesterase
MMTTPSQSRPAPVAARYDLDLPGGGQAELTLTERDRTQPFLLLHGGAGPASVAAFGDLLAAREHARVIVPTHPGFNGTPRPGALASVAALAQLYAALLERLDVWDVTVIGNSIGGWIAAELALLGSPRVSGAILVDAVGAEIPEHPATDVSGLGPQQLSALSFHDPSKAAAAAGGPGPSPEMVQANMGALRAYSGPTMSDPTLLGRLKDLDLPVHVIWGESDGIAGPDYGQALAAAIPGAVFTLLPDTGHMPQIETPEQLLAVISGDRGQPAPVFGG